VAANTESSRDRRWARWIDSRSARARWTAAAILAVVASIGIAAVTVAAWADRVLLDEDRFSARIASTLQHDEMNRYLADELTEQVLARAPELVGVRPAIEAVLSEALRTRTAVVGARSALREAHRGVRSGVAEEAIVIDLQAVITLATALMQRGAPDVAERFEAGLDTTRIDAGAVGLRTGLFERLERLTALTWPLVALSAICLVGCAIVAPLRRGGLLLASGAIAFAGAIGLAGQRGAEAWFVELLPARQEARDAVTLVWRSVLQEYRGWNAALLAVGIAGIVGASASARLPDLAAIRAGIVDSPWGRTIAGVGLAVAGLAVARWPLDAVRVLVVAAGILLAGGGLILLVRSAATSVAGVRPHEYLARLRDNGALRFIFTVAVVFAVGASIATWIGTTMRVEPSPVEPAPITVCNGHELLCDRPLNEVTFPGTHNSMAAASERGWYFPSQRYGIAQQLRDGVRALLVDTYYGIRSPQGVLTVINPDTRRPQLVAEHGEEVVAAAERVAATLGSDGEQEIFLCHSFCELGATPLAAALVDLRDFLDAYPGEFVVVIVQDTTSPEDTVAAFELADLAERAYTHTAGEPWPTLAELLAEGKQLLVLAEENAGAAEWYQPAYSILQETALTVAAASDLGCAPGRGGVDGPLFLMNHWVAERPPVLSRALEVNTLDVITDRSRECTEQRGRVPNIVAVDFYDVGDLFEAVDRLNGLPLPDPPARSATDSREPSHASRR